MMVRRMGSGAESVVMAEITAQMFMHRDVVSRMFALKPMRVIPASVFFVKIKHAHPHFGARVLVLETLLLNKQKVLFGEEC